MLLVLTVTLISNEVSREDTVTLPFFFSTCCGKFGCLTPRCSCIAFLGGMSLLTILALSIFTKHQRKSEIVQVKAQKKIVEEILTETVSESPNHFGKLDRARRKNCLKNPKKYWHVGDGSTFWRITESLSKSKNFPAESYKTF